MKRRKHRRGWQDRVEPPTGPTPASVADDAMEGPEVPQIDRRRVPRQQIQTQAWLAPADEFGATRTPVIQTRDLTAKGLGFFAKQDLSALGEAVLRLPSITTGRPVLVPCRVRRSLELGNGWFNGLVEFKHPQPNLGKTKVEPARIKPKKKKRR
jgi:hypothetical protein